MSKLLYADFTRLFQSRLFKFMLLFCAAMGLLFNITNAAASSEKTLAGTVEMGAVYLLPMLVAALLGLNILSEFTSGAIRNKIVIGHGRRAIVFSWLIVFASVMMLMLLVYTGVSFLSGWLMGFDMTGIGAGRLAANFGVILCSLLTNLIFCMLVCVVFADYRGLAILYVLMEFPVVGFSLLSMAYPDSKPLKFFFRFFTGGLMTDSLQISILTWPDRGWLTVLCTLSLGAVLLLLLLRHFSGKDLK